MKFPLLSNLFLLFTFCCKSENNIPQNKKVLIFQAQSIESNSYVKTQDFLPIPEASQYILKNSNNKIQINFKTINLNQKYNVSEYGQNCIRPKSNSRLTNEMLEFAKKQVQKEDQDFWKIAVWFPVRPKKCQFPFLGWAYLNSAYFVLATNSLRTFVHEIGHTLGINHAYGSNGMKFTVMGRGDSDGHDHFLLASKMLVGWVEREKIQIYKVSKNSKQTFIINPHDSNFLKKSINYGIEMKISNLGSIFIESRNLDENKGLFLYYYGYDENNKNVSTGSLLLSQDPQNCQSHTCNGQFTTLQSLEKNEIVTLICDFDFCTTVKSIEKYQNSSYKIEIEKQKIKNPVQIDFDICEKEEIEFNVVNDFLLVNLTGNIPSDLFIEGKGFYGDEISYYDSYPIHVTQLNQKIHSGSSHFFSLERNKTIQISNRERVIFDPINYSRFLMISSKFKNKIKLNLKCSNKKLNCLEKENGLNKNGICEKCESGFQSFSPTSACLQKCDEINFDHKNFGGFFKQLNQTHWFRTFRLNSFYNKNIEKSDLFLSKKNKNLWNIQNENQTLTFEIKTKNEVFNPIEIENFNCKKNCPEDHIQIPGKSNNCYFNCKTLQYGWDFYPKSKGIYKLKIQNITRNYCFESENGVLFPLKNKIAWFHQNDCNAKSWNWNSNEFDNLSNASIWVQGSNKRAISNDSICLEKINNLVVNKTELFNNLKKENEEKKECPISISPQPQMNCSKFGFKKIENKNFCYKKKSSCRGNLTNIIHLSTLKTKIIQCKKICQNIGIEKCKLFEFDRIEKNCKTFDFDFKNETILHRKSNTSVGCGVVLNFLK